MTVAVKKILNKSGKGRKEYITEVNLISSLRHPNLVQLKGWCHDGGQTTFLLVYEFMSEGSLDSHLFRARPALTWSVRYKIYKGLALALLYLHDVYLRFGTSYGTVMLMVSSLRLKAIEFHSTCGV
ncbi:putative protein kinase RLK-Pelle-L-LEC family [Rosa chinensis]|uniref:Protein kinase domain-containing protein n=2 Tax=Rosa chinensis TaxID=74649 RepID=A0A2P6RQ30_ROSCH|nr:putative protein kinase RLK-Pelle-L-LEC family [Rosa chinensis]